MNTQKLFFSILIFFLLTLTLWWFIGYAFFWNTTTETATSSRTAQSISINDLENNITKLVDETSPSVVSIVIKRDLPQYLSNPFGFFAQRQIGTIETEVWWGTGFFVDENGTIITNKHVVQDTRANYSVVLSNGDSFDAEVLARDPINDLAIMKVNLVSEPLPIRSKQSDIKIGQFVIANGNALSEFQNSVSFGVVSGKNRIIEAQGQKLSSLLQTDTAINPGNSWGPLINMAGEVIGINTAIASGQGLGFSIELSSEKIDYMLESIAESWEIKKPFIGIYFIPINELLAEELELAQSYWIYIPEESNSIIEWSSADLAGLERWDQILSVDWERITPENSLDVILQNKFPWEKLELLVVRDNREQIIELTLGRNM